MCSVIPSVNSPAFNPCISDARDACPRYHIQRMGLLSQCLLARRLQQNCWACACGGAFPFLQGPNTGGCMAESFSAPLLAAKQALRHQRSSRQQRHRGRLCSRTLGRSRPQRARGLWPATGRCLGQPASRRSCIPVACSHTCAGTGDSQHQQCGKMYLIGH